MALANDKAALFGKGSASASARPSAPAATAAVATRAPAGTTSVSTISGAAAPPRVPGIPSLPPHIRESKLAEARTLSDKGMAALKTSVKKNYRYYVDNFILTFFSTSHTLKQKIFQWSPDYVIAAPYFEQSGECYRTAGDLNNARLMFIQVSPMIKK